MPDDPWIEKHSPIAAEKLHALGYINLEWNVSEYHLNALLASVSGLDEATCRMFVYDMGDTAICDRIKAFAAKREFNAPMQAALDRGLEAYDICRLNRNHFNHFALASRSSEWGLRLHKVAKKPTLELSPIADEIKDFRRVAEEIRALNAYLGDLWLAARDSPSALPPPSPETLPLPQRLWKPPQATRTKPKRLPRSSP